MKDPELINVLRRFLAADKPKDCSPIDVLQVIRHLVQNGESKGTTLARATLARQLGCGETAIYESQERLKKLGWITKNSGKHKGKANRVHVIIDALPIEEELKKTVISEQSRKLAQDYMWAVKQIDTARKFHTVTEQRWAYRLETLLKKCDGNEERLRALINFAISGSMKFRLAFLKGPHELAKNWTSLVTAYDSQVAATAAKQAFAPGVKAIEAEIDAEFAAG